MTKVVSIINKIEKHFSFLYEKGFTRSTSEHSPELFGNWVVEFRSEECFIYIICDRSEIFLEIAPVKSPKIDNRVSLEKVIYIVSNGTEIVPPFKGNFAWGETKQLERLSNLLRRYLDKIKTHYKSLN